ncbi:MAG TPA: 3-hydroxybutyrate oligomer hydrolase family protein, partial [Geminicoccaceae bacterium]
NLCGYSFAAADGGPPVVLSPTDEAIIFSTSSGILPTGNVDLINNDSLGGPVENRFSVSPTSEAADLNLDGALCLRSLELGEDPATGAPLRGPDNGIFRRVQRGIEQIRASGDLQGKPAIFVTGRADAVLPPNHTSRAYFGLNRVVEGEDADLRYIEVLHAQHFEALIQFFPTTFIPLHHYFLEALNLMFEHLKDGEPLPESQVVRPEPRGAAADLLELANLPAIQIDAADEDEIRFESGEVRIPE